MANELTVQQALDQYRAQVRDHRLYSSPGGYNAAADYLNYGARVKPRESATVTLDANGVVMVKYTAEPDKPRYNTVTISQFGMGHYGRWRATGSADELRLLRAHADQLLVMQRADGALTYEYAWRYYLTGADLLPGWTSGMAQGQAMSLWLRAYQATGDERYLVAAELSYTHMSLCASRGGTACTLAGLRQEWQQYPFIQEYVSSPSAYTLNGYLFALLGLFDLSELTPSAARGAQLKAELGRHLDGLVHLLPFFEMREGDAGFTCYDLGHLTPWRRGEPPHVGVGYHSVHIYLLRALREATGDTRFQVYEQRWAAWVGQ